MFRFLLASVLATVLTSEIGFATAAPFTVGGDAIGPDSSATSYTGGFTAVQNGALNRGQPAILVTLSGQELLTELRVIVFGLAVGGVGPNFDDFDYRLAVWPAADYFANLPEQYQIELGAPVGIENVAVGPTSVVPAVPFGNAGPAGNNALTYDFRFDLTTPAAGSTSSVFATPLAAGEWVFGFQSWHDPATSGYLRVAGSIASAGPLPLFSRDTTPRGILGGQDPLNIALRWGISLTATPETTPQNLAGDYNRDAIVNAADYVDWRRGQAQVSGILGYELWRANFSSVLPVSNTGDFNADDPVDAADYVAWREYLGAATEAPLAFAGDGLNGVDDADYWVWRQHYGDSAVGKGTALVPLPEPSSLIQFVWVFVSLFCSRISR